MRGFIGFDLILERLGFVGSLRWFLGSLSVPPLALGALAVAQIVLLYSTLHPYSGIVLIAIFSLVVMGSLAFIFCFGALGFLLGPSAGSRVSFLCPPGAGCVFSCGSNLCPGIGSFVFQYPGIGSFVFHVFHPKNHLNNLS